MRRLICVLSCLALMLSGPARAGAADDCLTTYDRKGHVTGRWCPDGTSGPEAVSKAIPAAPRVKMSGRRVEGPGKPGVVAAKGVEIRCGGGRCKGVLDLGR
jgi:hypothetical protein